MKLAATLRALHGNKVAAAITELHRVEGDLASALVRASDRHRADHEVFHMARDLAGWSREHARRLSDAGRAYGLDLDPDAGHESSLAARVRQVGSELTGRFHEPSLLLISDMRHIHLMAAGASLDWEVLAQTAQALKDADLLAVAQRCHPETLRQMRWSNAKIKDLAAQALVAG